ncbi:MAG: hypothetical protein ACU0BJ_09455 [Shimia sp.]|uniref:hypothetical protein n=1 Tax=Shimia sp. TaxID=1954381 RepID=UPI00405A0F9B
MKRIEFTNLLKASIGLACCLFMVSAFPSSAEGPETLPSGGVNFKRMDCDSLRKSKKIETEYLYEAQDDIDEFEQKQRIYQKEFRGLEAQKADLDNAWKAESDCARKKPLKTASKAVNKHMNEKRTELKLVARNLDVAEDNLSLTERRLKAIAKELKSRCGKK